MSVHNLQLKAVVLHHTMLEFTICLACLLVPNAFAASGLFPKMPAAPKAYVVEIANDSENAKMTAWALQGMPSLASLAQRADEIKMRFQDAVISLAAALMFFSHHRQAYRFDWRSR